MLAAALLACAFPALPSEAELAVISPEDGEVYRTGETLRTDLSLRYAITGLHSASRICLRLLRGSLRMYRGPVLHRRVDALAHYASGCFAVGQPVTFQNLVAGNYALFAWAQDNAQQTLKNATAVIFGVDDGTRSLVGPPRPSEFQPTYEWQDVPENQSVPAGLEISIALGEHQRRARIPSTWRLQVFLSREFGGFFRMDVHRDTSIAEIERAASDQVEEWSQRRQVPDRAQHLCASLFAGAARLSALESAEQAMLFQIRGNLRVELRSCSSPSNARASFFSRAGGAPSSLQLVLHKDSAADLRVTDI